MRTVLWASLVLMLHTPPSFAHPLMVGYADIAITDREVEVRLSVNLSELDQLMSLDANRNGEVEGEELAAKATQISDYLRKKVQVRVGDAILPMEAEPFRIRRSLDGKPTLEATLRFRSVEALETFTILCEPLTELGADHRTLATITREGRVGQFLFQQGAVYQGDHGRPRGFWAYALQFIGLGIHHIFVGYDHIAFLLGLLLIGGRLLGIIKIVTSFTVAHSVTLSLAALNIVSLPPGLVERLSQRLVDERHVRHHLARLEVLCHHGAEIARHCAKGREHRRQPRDVGRPHADLSCEREQAQAVAPPSWRRSSSSRSARSGSCSGPSSLLQSAISSTDRR